MLNETVHNDNNDDLESSTNIIVYADDNTPSAANEDPSGLKNILEYNAKTVTDWFNLNEMITSGDKTELLIIGTKFNRARKLEANNVKVKIKVCEDTVEESNNEKLLGVIVNNTLTWKDHLIGNDENKGLLNQLSQRIGILKTCIFYEKTL